jgi:glutamine synthetase
MAKTAQEVMQLISEQGIKMVDFKMVDINGQYRHVTIPAQNFTEATMTDGIGFDASNYGYAVVEKSDMVFIPDPATAQIDPFCEVSTLSMTGNAMIIDYPHNRPLDQYPRNIVLAAGICNDHRHLACAMGTKHKGLLNVGRFGRA